MRRGWRGRGGEEEEKEEEEEEEEEEEHIQDLLVVQEVIVTHRYLSHGTSAGRHDSDVLAAYIYKYSATAFLALLACITHHSGTLLRYIDSSWWKELSCTWNLESSGFENMNLM